LTVPLAAGIALAWVTTALEQTSHSHNQIVVKMTENSL
jgi:hypothetical protein